MDRFIGENSLSTEGILNPELGTMGSKKRNIGCSSKFQVMDIICTFFQLKYSHRNMEKNLPPKLSLDVIVQSRLLSSMSFPRDHGQVASSLSESVPSLTRWGRAIPILLVFVRVNRASRCESAKHGFWPMVGLGEVGFLSHFSQFHFF